MPQREEQESSASCALRSCHNRVCFVAGDPEVSGRSIAMRIVITAVVLAFFSASAQAQSVSADKCDQLAASLKLPNTTVTSAKAVAAGTVHAAGRRPRCRTLASLPAFCRVALTIKPTQRLRHQVRSLAADVGLERQVPAGRQRRVGRIDSVRRARRRRCGAATPRRPPTPATPAPTRASPSGIRRS